MSDNVAFFCLAEGDSKEKVFKVIAGINDDVNDLKEKIKMKKPNLFANTDANDIVLWKVNISIDDDMEVDVFLKNIQDKSKLSHPSGKIYNIFTKRVAEESIHIIVEQPSSKNRIY